MTRPNVRPALLALALGAAAAGPVAAQEAPGAAQAAEHYAGIAADADVSLAEPLVQGTSESGDNPWACASCHGAQGEGAETVPRLAGLPAGYIVKQLHDYASGARKNENMQYVVARLDDNEMAALGAYYSELVAPASAAPSLGGDMALGRKLALEGAWGVDMPSCFSCHGPAGWGVEQAFPPIAGQHAAYINTQLANWKSGRRANAPVRLMHAVAAVMSSDDMAAVSDYLASLPPVQPAGEQAIPVSARETEDE